MTGAARVTQAATATRVCWELHLSESMASYSGRSTSGSTQRSLFSFPGVYIVPPDSRSVSVLEEEWCILSLGPVFVYTKLFQPYREFLRTV